MFVLRSCNYLSVFSFFSYQRIQNLPISTEIEPKFQKKKGRFFCHCIQNLRFLFAISLQKNLGIYTVLSLVPSNPEHYFIFCIHFLLQTNIDVLWNYKLHLLRRINICHEFVFWILNVFMLQNWQTMITLCSRILLENENIQTLFSLQVTLKRNRDITWPYLLLLLIYANDNII